MPSSLLIKRLSAHDWRYLGEFVPALPGKLTSRRRVLGQPLQDAQVGLGDGPQHRVVVHA
jgi:hypothetical protein